MSFFSTLLQKTTPFAVSIYADGDSTTAGGFGATVYPAYYKIDLEALVNNLTVTTTNVAVSGQSQAQMLSDLTSQILNNNPDIITVSTCLNDTVEFNNSTLAGNIRSYINTCLAKVLPSGLCPQLILCTDNLSGQELAQVDARPYANQVAVKNLVLNTYKEYIGNPNIWIVDFFALYDALGGAGNPDTAALYAKLVSDKVHPNDAGYAMNRAAITPVLKNVIDKIRLFK